MIDRLTLLTAFANRSALPGIWQRFGVVQGIEHESGSGRSWIVHMQPEQGKRYSFCILWSLDGKGRVAG